MKPAEESPLMRCSTAISTINLEITVIRIIVGVAILILMSACQKAAVPSEGKGIADILSGDAKGAAANNPLCKLFSVDEASAYAGKSLNAGTNAAMGSGCQWATGDGEAMTMIAAVPTQYADSPSQAPSFRNLPDMGRDGYVAADMGGWVAGTSTAKEFIKVTVTGPKASEASAIALLKETLRRRQ
jgi:hypothetical protein